MFVSTNQKPFSLYLVILTGFCLIVLILAPRIIQAAKPVTKPAAKPIELSQTPRPVDVGQVPSSMENQNLLLVVPQTGSLSFFGKESVRGAKLAFKVWGAGFNLEQANEEERVESQVPNLDAIRVVIGHYSEKSLTRSAPYYIHYQIPVLLPYLENPEISSLNENFFQLMPDYGTQGRRLAQEVLSQKKPTKIVMLVGPERPQRLLADAFANTLRQGFTSPPSGQNKSPKKLAPLSSKIPVHRLDINVLGELSALKDIKGSSQDLVLLALSPNLALESGPILSSSTFRKARYLAGSSLGLREVGAEYRALGLNLTLCLPVAPAPKNNDYNVFTRRYEYSTKNSPTWPAVLAYDAVTLAVKAASMGNIKEYLGEPNRPHKGLTTSYLLNKGASTQLMKVDGDTLAFLP
jgi:ABC-type branched-subunit amino acid transport system substrate-binding protein